MTISASFSFNPSADAIVKQALQLAGLLALGQQPQTQILSDARDMLTTLLKALQNKGVVLTTAERKTLPLVAGTASYNLDADTIDVEFPTTLTAAGATSETFVERMVYSQFQELTDKSAQGTPTRAYVERLATVSVTFWNVPNGSFTWNYRRIRLIRDMSDGAATLDMTQRWIEAIVWKLAQRMALAGVMPASKVQYLETQARDAEKAALGSENERGDLQFCLTGPYG